MARKYYYISSDNGDQHHGSYSLNKNSNCHHFFLSLASKEK